VIALPTHPGPKVIDCVDSSLIGHQKNNYIIKQIKLKLKLKKNKISTHNLNNLKNLVELKFILLKKRK